MRWMKPIIQTEISQKEKGKYCNINAYIWNLERWKWWPYMQVDKGDTDINNRVLHSVGEDKGGMIWEKSFETCTLPYVKQMISASSMHEAGHLKPVLRDNPEGWGGDRCGRGVQGGRTPVCLWPIHVAVWQKLSQYCKVIILQLKYMNQLKIKMQLLKETVTFTLGTYSYIFKQQCEWIPVFKLI